MLLTKNCQKIFITTFLKSTLLERKETFLFFLLDLDEITAIPVKEHLKRSFSFKDVMSKCTFPEKLYTPDVEDLDFVDSSIAKILFAVTLRTEFFHISTTHHERLG